MTGANNGPFEYVRRYFSVSFVGTELAIVTPVAVTMSPRLRSYCWNSNRVLPGLSRSVLAFAYCTTLSLTSRIANSSRQAIATRRIGLFIAGSPASLRRQVAAPARAPDGGRHH